MQYLSIINFSVSTLPSNLKNCSYSPYTLLVLFPFLIHRRLACAILSRQSFPYFFVYSVLSGQGWQLTKQVLQKSRSQQEQYTRCCWWKSPEISRRRNRSEIVMNLFSNYLCMNEYYSNMVIFEYCRLFTLSPAATCATSTPSSLDTLFFRLMSFPIH